MFSRIRKRLTYANVAMTLALVFAMTGGAYAAKKYLITSTKQISPKVLKQLQGKAGPAGVNGANGVNGKDGAQGLPGTGSPGPEGKAGTSVTSAGVPTSSTTCSKQGGVELTSSSGKTTICNGTTGFTKTLPSGETEKGNWSVSSTAEASAFAASTVSFSIPLAEVPAVHWIKANGKEATASGEQVSTVCKGSVTNPTAPKGSLCVYTGNEANLSTTQAENEFLLKWRWGLKIDNWPSGEGSDEEPNTANPFGFGVQALGTESLRAGGTWAVTAE
jgi:hypothetical protein